MLSVKVLYAFPLDNMRLLVFFEDDTTKIFDVKPIVKDYPEFAALENPDLFNLVKVEPGGYGVSWNSELDCSEGELYENGEPIPLSFEDFKNFARFSIVNTAEASSILNCSRQNVDVLISRGKLKPFKVFPKDKLFFKSDLFARNENKRSYNASK